MMRSAWNTYFGWVAVWLSDAVLCLFMFVSLFVCVRVCMLARAHVDACIRVFVSVYAMDLEQGR